VAGPGAPRSGTAVLLVGGVHGDEPASVEAVLELVRLVGQDRLAQDGVLVIPALNPDGLVAGSKNSAADVDLNRNFPARNFTTQHAPGYHPGPHPLSEPETAALAQVLELCEARAVITVHAPFACINFDGPALAWAEAVAAACGYPARADLGYPTPGSFGSWWGVDRGLPVLTIELPAGPYAEFAAAAEKALQASVAWAVGRTGPG